jgi:hypothetical protein
LTREYEQILLQPERELTERSRHPIQGKKMIMMILMNMMIAGSKLGFCLIEFRPKWRMLNVEYSYHNRFAALIPLHQDDGWRKLVRHADNVTVNTA